MNGTVLALQHFQNLQPLQPSPASQPLQALRRGERPARAEVEAAVRTIIRWVGEDPGREGLIETPARFVSALEEFFSGYGEDPAELLQKSFDEIDGYDEMVVLREVRFESHCEHHNRADCRAGRGRLCAARARRLHQQACPRGAGLCPPPADPGKIDRPDRQYDRGRTPTKRCRRGYQSGASLHDDTRRAQTGQQSGHEPHAGMLSHRPRASPAVSRYDRMNPE